MVKLKKTTLQILLVIGVILLFKPNLIGMQLFSTVSYPAGLTSASCEQKETLCFESDNLMGKLVNCRLGSGNKCYCEFQSYSRNICPDNEQPTGKATGDSIITTQRTTQPSTTQTASVGNFFENKIGPFKVLWILIFMGTILLLLILGGGSRFAGLKPTGGTITLGK